MPGCPWVFASVPRRALRRRASGWRGSGSRRAGLDGRAGVTRLPSGVSPPSTSRKFPSAPAREAEGRGEPPPGPRGRSWRRGKENLRCAPEGLPPPCPPVPYRSPPELPVFRAARRCGCEMLAEPEVKPWPLVFCSPPKSSPGRAGQRLPASVGCQGSHPMKKCSISGLSLFPEVLELRMVILVASPLPAPLSYLYVEETHNFRQKFGL